MMTVMTWIAVLVASIFGWDLYRRFSAGRIVALNEKRRAGSRIVGRGEFVDGGRHLEVALALTQETFFYENRKMKASLDLRWIRQVEYDSELTTGAGIPDGKVLRLRSGGRAFEFILPFDVADRWRLTLPPRGAAARPASTP